MLTLSHQIKKRSRIHLVCHHFAWNKQDKPENESDARSDFNYIFDKYLFVAFAFIDMDFTHFDTNGYPYLFTSAKHVALMSKWKMLFGSQ